MRVIFRLPLLALLPMALFAGCADDDGPPTFETTLSLRDADNVETSTFASGQPIKFVMTVRNLTDLPQKLTFTSSHTMDFMVYRAMQLNGRPLWYSTEGQGFTQAFVYIEWAPDETKEFSFLWDQHLYGFPNPGPLIAAGSYEAQSFLFGYGGDYDLLFGSSGAKPQASEYRSGRVPFTIE